MADYFCFITGGDNQNNGDNMHSSIKRALNVIDKHLKNTAYASRDPAN